MDELCCSIWNYMIMKQCLQNSVNRCRITIMQEILKLRKRDLEKEKDQAWYRKKNMLGMMLYIDNFAGNLRGVKGKLKYLKNVV